MQDNTQKPTIKSNYAVLKQACWIKDQNINIFDILFTCINQSKNVITIEYTQKYPR